jgi:hypothetical protein
MIMKTTWMVCLTAVGVLGSLSAACTSTSDQASAGAADTSGTCSPEQQLDAYNHMITQPIVPPRMVAGIDVANGDDWKGLKVEDAEQTLCGGTVIPPGDGADSTVETKGWGVAPNYQVQLEYNKSTRAVDMWQINAGYKGTLDFKSRPHALGDPSKPNPFGQHTYSVGVDRPILRDGQPFVINWQNRAQLDAQSTELFDALMFTFAPQLPSTQASCKTNQLCRAISNNGDGTAGFGARPLGVYLNIPDPINAGSTPNFLYGFPVKVMPFSYADMTLKIDAEGPVAVASGLGDKSSTCTMKLGMPLQSFLGDCVQVASDAHQNDLLKQELLGGAQRVVSSSGSQASGTWLLQDNGIHPNFDSERFDETSPAPTARATELTLDIRASGKVRNDYSADGATVTLAGTTAVYAEYARTVQDFLHSKMDASLPQFPLGDAHCTLPADGDASTWKPARGCTGMEQFTLPASMFYMVSALKPGDPLAFFCADPGVFNHCGDPICDDTGNHCVDDKLGLSGALWDTTRAHVVAVLGGGNEANVPADARDTKTYLLLWTKALVKYLRVAAQAPTDLSSPSFDSFTPADSDITIEPQSGNLVKVKYLNKLEMLLTYVDGNVETITFR